MNDTSKDTQMVRQWKILLTLESAQQGSTLRELADEHDVDLRTIQRDLRDIEAAGFPLYDETDGNIKRWRLLINHHGLKAFRLTAGEAFALLVAEDKLGELRDTPIGEAYQSLTRKARQILKPLEKQSQPITEAYIGKEPIARDYSACGEEYKVIFSAINRRALLDMHYYSAWNDELTERTVAPLGFWNAGGEVYLLAFCYTRNEGRSFRLDRIRRVKPSKAELPWPEDFDKQEFVSHSFGPWIGDAEEVVLRFAPGMADYLSNLKVHESQQFSLRDNGEIDLSLDVVPSLSLLSWVAGFGGDVRVIKPERLREQLASLHQRGLSANEV